MKFTSSIFVLFIFAAALFAPVQIRADQNALLAQLDNVDAVRAVALANEWRWTHPDIKSSVDAWNVTFKFPDGRVRKISMPSDKMLVAIAPYIKRTHT